MSNYPAVPRKAAIRAAFVKNWLDLYFIEEGRSLKGVTTYYNPFKAQTDSVHYSNDGKPTAYLRFTNASVDGDEVTREELEKAVAFAIEKSGMNDLMPIRLDAEKPVVKLDLSLIFEQEKVTNFRPSRKVEKEAAEETKVTSK